MAETVACVCQSALSGSATCVAVRLSIIGTSCQDERSRQAEKEGGAEAAETVACVRQSASSGSATCVSVRFSMIGTSCQDDLANGGLSDYVT